MNRKQRTMLARILVAAALLVALHFVPATGALRFLLYLEIGRASCRERV